MPELRRWSPMRLFVATIIAAATFGACFVLGNAITVALGPGMSGIATIIVTTILVVVGARIVETRGVFTLMVFLFTVLAIPTNMFGPPGPHKAIIGIVTGLVYDGVWNVTGRRSWSLFLAAALATACSIFLIFGLMVILEYPRADYLRAMLKYLVPAYAALGWIGAMLGNRIYETSLRELSLVKQLRA